MQRAAYTRWLADQVLSRHGLRDWHFDFDRAINRCGACHFRKKKISLSIHFVTDVEVEDATIADVLLHECAHALTGAADHGEVWQTKALEIGCTGSRLIPYTPKVLGRYYVSCGCGRTGFYRHRLSRKLRESHCATCAQRLHVLRFK